MRFNEKESIPYFERRTTFNQHKTDAMIPPTLNASRSCDRTIWKAELDDDGDSVLVVVDGEVEMLLELCVPFIVELEAVIFAGDPLAARLARKMFIALSSWATPELPSQLSLVHLKLHVLLFLPPEHVFPAPAADGRRAVYRVSPVLAASCIVWPSHCAARPLKVN